MAKIEFGYWGIRGLAQVSRLLLAYSGLAWEDKKYTAPEQWFGKDKIELGIPFANLPYLIDGDFKLSESTAVNRYIIQKSGKTDLLGKNIHDNARVNQIIGVIGDLRKETHPIITVKDTPRGPILEKILPKIKELEHFIGDKPFALGYLTLTDFVLTEASYFVEKLFPEEYAKLPALQRIRANFEALPEIKAYYALPTAVKGPFTPPGISQIDF